LTGVNIIIIIVQQMMGSHCTATNTI